MPNIKKFNTAQLAPQHIEAVSRRATPISFARLGTAFLLAPFVVGNYAGAQATDLDFDVAGVQTKVMAILGVGVAIAIGFAVYTLGKRGTKKL